MKNKAIWIVGFLVLVITITKVAIYFSYSPAERHLYKTLQRSIKSRVFEIPLKELTNFEWEELWYLGPYSQVQRENKIWLEGKAYPMESDIQLKLDNDGMWAFCFIHKGIATQIIRGDVVGYNYPEMKKRGNMFTPEDIMVIERKDCYRFYIRRL